jgi:3-oxoacyl-(acyl-carrier-protein) synthase
VSPPADGAVVVTGVGVVAASGPASGLCGRIQARDAQTWPEDAVRDALAAGLSKRERRRSDLASQLALLATREAIADAGWHAGVAPCPPERAGCVLGTFLGAAANLHDEYDAFRRGELFSSLTSTWLFANMPTANVAIDNGFHGESFGVVAGMTSGVQAIGHAARLLRSGELDVAL